MQKQGGQSRTKQRHRLGAAGARLLFSLREGAWRLYTNGPSYFVRYTDRPDTSLRIDTRTVDALLERRMLLADERGELTLSSHGQALARRLRGPDDRIEY